MATSFPDKFSYLEPLAAWALPIETERYAKRISISMEELVVFYTALKPHMEDLIQHLSGYPWGAPLPPQEERLAHLGMMYMEAAVPIELKWKNPEAEDSFPVARLDVPERA